MREYQIQLEYLKNKCSNYDEQILMPKPSEYRHELNLSQGYRGLSTSLAYFCSWPRIATLHLKLSPSLLA